MNNQQERRERIAAQVLASIIASDKGYTLRVDVDHAIRAADELIAELDRTSPQQTRSNQPETPAGWVIWEDGEDGLPIRDRKFWVAIHGYDVVPFATKAEAEAELSSWGAVRNYRVRRWPLDPSEDKEVQP